MNKERAVRVSAECSPPLKKMKVEGGGGIRGKHETPLQPGVAELPDGAWAEWGRDAVYFVGLMDLYYYRPGAVDPDMRGLTIYAINPTDASLPIYRVFDFSFHKDNPIRNVSGAVVDSRAYVVGNGHIWVRDIGAGDIGWQDGPQFSGAPSRICPELFVLGGKLFAIRLKVFGLVQRELFEVLVEGSWRSLPQPPALSRLDEDPEPLLCIGGWSCIGDRRIIMHIVYCYSSYDQHCFLCFQVHDDFKSGLWTWLEPSFRGISPMRNYIVHSSHLCSGDALVLPEGPTGCFLSVFGFGAAPDGNDFVLETIPEMSIGWKFPEEEHSSLHWHLISMGGSRYCAIAFPSSFSLDVTVLTFHQDAAGNLKDLVLKKHKLGVQSRPSIFLSGRAYSSCTA